MKILYVTTIGGTMRFFDKFIKELVENGHTVDIAANTKASDVPNVYKEMGCKIIPISCTRSPINKGTLVAIKQLKRIVSQGNYDIVHCHTPIAAMCTRLACREVRKMGTRVIYTAHGFHFYKGAPLKNWFIYYPVEKICARLTDVLITINREDYGIACQKLKAGKIEYVPGVGIDVAKYTNVDVDRDLKRDELGIPRDAFLIVSVGDLNRNKNHEVIIRALAKLRNRDVHYGIAGKGKLRGYLIDLAKELGLEDRVHLLGFRSDVPELYKSADLCAFPSIREGLGLAAIEGMAAGLPLLVSDNRGAKSYATHLVNAMICPVGKDAEPYTEAINRLLSDESLRIEMGAYNRDFAKNFEVRTINDRMREIYNL